MYSTSKKEKNMSNPTPRSKVKQSQTWNAESVFASSDAFETETESILKSLNAFKKYQGHLGDDPDTFIKAMTLFLRKYSAFLINNARRSHF
jgi:hypothetical protein